MDGLGFAIGGAGQGLMQGFNMARQNAIQQAYLKMQQQHQNLLSQSALMRPLEQMGSHPETAPAMGPAYAEAQRFAQNPEGYSYQPPNVEAPTIPHGTPGYEDLAATEYPTTTTTPAAIPGYAGFQEMLKSAGTQARQLQIDAESRKMEMMIRRLQATIGIGGEKAYASSAGRHQADYDAAQAGLLGAPVEAKTAASESAKMPFVGPRATAQGMATGKLAPGTVNIPGAGPMAAGGGVQRTLNEKQRNELASQREAIGFLDSLETAFKDPNGPQTGAWFAAKTHPTVRMLSSLLPKGMQGNPDDPAFSNLLGEHIVTYARAHFPGRITNMDIQFLQRVVPRPGFTPEQNAANAASLKAWALRKYQETVGSYRGAGFDVSGFENTGFPKMGLEEMTGRVPQGQFSLPGADNLGVSPVPPPGGKVKYRYIGAP